MPLPDADKKSPRVYTLLQNQDLENVTADTLADVADTISIEEANEDELRRICLVAFARMVTKGSFDGWLSGGGGGMDQVGVLENATYKYYSITQAAPWGALGPATGTDVINYDTPAYVPFVCPNDGDLAGISVDLTSAGSANLYAGIYSSTDGLPDSLLGYATMDMNVSTGNVRQTSFSSTITLVIINQEAQAALGPTGDVENGYSQVIIETGTTHTLPATTTPANFQVTSEARIMCNLDW